MEDKGKYKNRNNLLFYNCGSLCLSMRPAPDVQFIQLHKPLLNTSSDEAPFTAGE